MSSRVSLVSSPLDRMKYSLSLRAPKCGSAPPPMMRSISPPRTETRKTPVSSLYSGLRRYPPPMRRKTTVSPSGLKTGPT